MTRRGRAGTVARETACRRARLVYQGKASRWMPYKPLSEVHL